MGTTFAIDLISKFGVETALDSCSEANSDSRLCLKKLEINLVEYSDGIDLKRLFCRLRTIMLNIYGAKSQGIHKTCAMIGLNVE